jgi:hypothetical protein
MVAVKSPMRRTAWWPSSWNGVAEVDVRRGRIDPQLDAERAAETEFFQEFFFRKDLGGSGGKLGELLFWRHGKWAFAYCEARASMAGPGFLPSLETRGIRGTASHPPHFSGYRTSRILARFA